ncbi:8480_t:CDS:2, partial [Ambispora leptoticha]
MSNLSKCDVCQKTELKPGDSGVYIGDYRGNKTEHLHVCLTCCRAKKQEYLENYAFIYSHEQEFRNQKRDTGYLKADETGCYADKKDQNAKLNSPEYVAMPDLITYNDRYADMLVCEHIVSYEELEKDDFEEIANLVEKRRKEKEQLFEQKRSQILENDGGEDNPNNFKKWVEIDDQITITPYEVIDRSSEKPRKDNSDVLLWSIWTGQKSLVKEINDNLLRYFRENDIKEISLKDNRLVIKHNNNEI